MRMEMRRKCTSEQKKGRLNEPAAHVRSVFSYIRNTHIPTRTHLECICICMSNIHINRTHWSCMQRRWLHTTLVFCVYKIFIQAHVHAWRIVLLIGTLVLAWNRARLYMYCLVHIVVTVVVVSLRSLSLYSSFFRLTLEFHLHFWFSFFTWHVHSGHCPCFIPFVHEKRSNPFLKKNSPFKTKISIVQSPIFSTPPRSVSSFHFHCIFVCMLWCLFSHSCLFRILKVGVAQTVLTLSLCFDTNTIFSHGEFLLHTISMSGDQ